MRTISLVALLEILIGICTQANASSFRNYLPLNNQRIEVYPLAGESKKLPAILDVGMRPPIKTNLQVEHRGNDRLITIYGRSVASLGLYVEPDLSRITILGIGVAIQKEPIQGVIRGHWHH